jgi:hypothetical protein
MNRRSVVGRSDPIAPVRPDNDRTPRGSRDGVGGAGLGYAEARRLAAGAIVRDAAERNPADAG